MFIIVLIFSTLRLSNDPLEIYACVTKIYGHGRCLVHTVCGKELLCIIRNKFKGRSKRGNTIATLNNDKIIIIIKRIHSTFRITGFFLSHAFVR